MKSAFLKARANAVRAVQAAPAGFVVQIGEPNRTLEQNAAQWPYLASTVQIPQAPQLEGGAA